MHLGNPVTSQFYSVVADIIQVAGGIEVHPQRRRERKIFKELAERQIEAHAAERGSYERLGELADLFHGQVEVPLTFVQSFCPGIVVFDSDVEV